MLLCLAEKNYYVTGEGSHGDKNNLQSFFTR